MSASLPFRDINVHSSSTYYAFSSPSSPNAPTLVIDRPSGDIRLNDGKLTGGTRVSNIPGILGILKLRLDTYIITIAKATLVGRIKGHQVYKVAATEFLPLRERSVKDPDEDTYIALVKELLRSGPMYFSYTLDLTNSFQRQAESDPKEPLWARADDRFFWNKFICGSLIDFRTGKKTARASASPQAAVDPYILPVMFGMMSITNTSIKGNPLTFILITRRSRHRAGTRYLSRGIDEAGHVSNFNEAEQTIVLNDSGSGADSKSGRETQVLSYVQTRGSVPVYWAEVNTLKYTPTLQIRGVDSAVNAAKLHFDEQIKLYGDNYLVNLVNQKGREMKVKNAYEQMVKLLQSDSGEQSESDHRTNEALNVIESSSNKSKFDKLHYVYFDFHNETKGLKWHRAQLLLDELKNGLIAGGYFHGIDTPSGQVDVRRRQTAAVRTNCMDCLDRTNVIQSMLGRWTLSRMLVDLGMLKSGESAAEDKAFEFTFRNVWADNADVVSKSYSGTGALKTDFTRTGKRTRAGALQDLSNSITRYVRNNYTDGPRQDGFDIFLGNYRADASSIGSHQFADRRPLIVQAVPYMLGMCMFFIIVSTATTKVPNSTLWPLRFFTFCCVGSALYSGRFMWLYGTLYVNWPKLNTPVWVVENFQETLEKARKDPIFGPLLGRSDPRLGYLEEGKKRRE